MKILHVLNTAGVASVIAKFMDEIYGTESRVITRKAHDRYGLTTCGETRSEGFWMFYFKMVLEAGKHDIVHLHDRDILIPKSPLILTERLFGNGNLKTDHESL